MHTPTSAVNLILRHIDTLPPRTVALSETLDRVLAEDIVSPIDIPYWNNSAMDGYAVRTADVSNAPPVTLTVIEQIPAGAFPHEDIGPGQCSRIFTGAPVPVGADCVIRQEDTTRIGNQEVRIDNTRDAGRNVRYRGEDIERNSVALQAGTLLGPAELGVLASLAQDRVSVFGAPIVAIMGSGDEIADLDEREEILAGRKIASSNTYTLTSLIRHSCGQPLNLGVAKDDPEDVRSRLERADSADLLVTTAGISVGEHDFMRQVLKDLHLDEKFWRIRMRPGAPVGFGLVGALGGLPWIGLPGNPVSTMVTFELFVRPVIRKMLGHRLLFRRTHPVEVGEPIKLSSPLRHFLRATLSRDNDSLRGRLTGGQGSGILTSMVKADALIIVPEDRDTVEPGQILQGIILNDPEHVEEAPW